MNNEYAKIANGAAKGYKRSLDRGSITLDDLRQEALLAILESEGRYDPNSRITKNQYLFRVAILRLRAYTTRQIAPVTSRSNNRIPELRTCLNVGEVTEYTYAGEVIDFSDLLMQLQNIKKASTAILELAKDVKHSELALRFLVGHESAKSVSASSGVHIVTLYRAARIIKARLSASKLLKQVYEEF